jgi:hypothetical protein
MPRCLQVFFAGVSDISDMYVKLFGIPREGSRMFNRKGLSLSGSQAIVNP